MKYILVLLASLLITSCTYTSPTDYQNWVSRTIIANWKEYRITNIKMCDASSCNVWFVYPSDWTWIVLLQNETWWKWSYNVPIAILE